MTDFLDLVRHVGQDAGGTAPALGILLRVTVLLLAAMLVVLVLRRSSANCCRHSSFPDGSMNTIGMP